MGRIGMGGTLEQDSMWVNGLIGPLAIADACLWKTTDLKLTATELHVFMYLIGVVENVKQVHHFHHLSRKITHRALCCAAT